MIEVIREDSSQLETVECMIDDSHVQSVDEILKEMMFRIERQDGTHEDVYVRDIQSVATNGKHLYLKKKKDNDVYKIIGVKGDEKKRHCTILW